MNTLSLNPTLIGKVKNVTLREILSSILFPQNRVMMSYGNYNDYGNYDDSSYSNYNDYGNYDETYNFISCWNKEYQIDKKKNQKGGDIKDWYNNTVERVLTDTQLNHRYYSCVALCVIAYKNDVPIETVTADLNRIADDWALREDWKHDPFKRANLKNALRCYSDKYLTVSSEQLEEWLGWKFQEAKKERKPQQEFLREEAERKVKKTRQAIAAAICENPYANITEIAKIAGVSRPTVYKHIDAVKKLLDNNQQGNVDSSCK